MLRLLTIGVLAWFFDVTTGRIAAGRVVFDSDAVGRGAVSSVTSSGAGTGTACFELLCGAFALELVATGRTAAFGMTLPKA